MIADKYEIHDLAGSKYVKVFAKMPTWRDVIAILRGRFTPQVVITQTEEIDIRLHDSMLFNSKPFRSSQPMSDFVGVAPVPREERLRRAKENPSPSVGPASDNEAWVEKMGLPKYVGIEQVVSGR